MSRDALSHADLNLQTDPELANGSLAAASLSHRLPSRPGASTTNISAAMNPNLNPNPALSPSPDPADQPIAQYRSRPVAVAVDPVALVISECISVTSAMRKHARWAHSSVSSILGGSPNSVQLGPSNPLIRPRIKPSSSGLGADGALDVGVANRWGLRGQKGKSMADNPLMAGFGRLRHDLSSCKGGYSPMNSADVHSAREGL